MRVALVSDQHFDAARKLDETTRVHHWIADDIVRRGVDAVLLGGDLFERKSVPEDRNAAVAWLLQLGHVAPVVGVYGNHESPDDLEVLNHLNSDHPIVFYDRPAVHQLPGLSIACLPWPRMASLLAAIGRPVPHEQVNQVAVDALRAILLWLGAQLDECASERLFLGHCMIRASRVSTGQPVAPGADFEIGIEDLGLVRASAYLLGHMHLMQSWSINGAPCFFPGSPTRRTYGEVETKYYAIVTVDNGRAEVEYIPTPARPMHLIQGAWIPPQNGRSGELQLDKLGQDLLANAAAGSADNAEIRIRYDVDADQQAVARPAAALVRDVLLAHGAADVKLEPVPRAVVRAKAPEVARAASLADKLQAFWASREVTPEPDRAARLLAKLGQLDSEVERFEGVSGAIRMERLRFGGFRPYREEVDIDVAALPGQLIAICGDNGAGKSTMIEIFPGALFRRMPTHGWLADMATSRGAFVEATISNGKTWTIRQSVDCETRTGKSLVLDCAAKKPAFRGTGVTEYDKWAARHIQPSPLFLATSFGAQRSGGFIDMGDGDRMAVVLRALGIERHESLAKRAGDHSKVARSTRDRLEGGLKVERERFGDVEAALVTHAEALTKAADADAVLEAAQATHVKALEEVARAREAARRREEALRVREELTGRLAEARGQIQTLLARRSEGAALLAQADEIRRAAQELAEAATRETQLCAELERHETAANVAARDAKEARRREAAAQERAKAAEQRVAKHRESLRQSLDRAQEERRDLDERIVGVRDGILAHADVIRSAEARLPDVVTQQSAAHADVERLREAYRSAVREADQHAAAATKEEEAFRTAKAPAGAIERARRAAETLRAQVTEALTALDSAREEATLSAAQVERCRAEAERLDGIQVAGAATRIDALRGGYAEILLHGERAPEEIAQQALLADDTTAELARTLPEQRAEARRALQGAQQRAEAARCNLADIEKAAARAPGAEAAEVTLRELAERIAAAESSAAQQRRLEQEARDRAATTAEEGKRARDRAATLAEEQRALDPVAKRAVALAGAETLIGGWQARIGQLDADEERLSRELAAIPPGGGPDGDAAAEEARRERAVAEDAEGRVTEADRAAGAARRALVDLATERERLGALAARADDLTREEARAPERVDQIQRLSAEAGRIETALAAVAEVEVPAEPDLVGPQTALRAAEAVVRQAHADVAVAARALEQARAGTEKIKALAADLCVAEEAISDWDRLARDLGRDGLQAAEIDCVGPELSGLTNDLLHNCYSTRWTATLRAAKTSKDGTREVEGFEARIFDSVDGREADARFFSPGQKALIGEAMANALSIVACRRAGVDGPTLFRDETSSGLDAESARGYVAMLRRVATAVGANKVFFISHAEEMKEMADVRIEIRDGRVFGLRSAVEQTSRKAKGEVEALTFTAQHQYAEAGRYRIAARVTDVFGNDGIATVSCEVE